VKLEDVRRELKEDRALAQRCPRCGDYGKPLGATEGRYVMASHCEGCDVVFGWDRKTLHLPPPSNAIELGDKITALNDAGEVVTGVVLEIKIVRDTDRGSRNERALLQLRDDGLREWVGLRGAFVTEKSAVVPFTGILPHDDDD